MNVFQRTFILRADACKMIFLKFDTLLHTYIYIYMYTYIYIYNVFKEKITLRADPRKRNLVLGFLTGLIFFMITGG